MRRVIVAHPLVRSASTAFVRPNWLETNCGDVPRQPQVQNSKASEMLRGGHVLQVASAKMLNAKVAFIARVDHSTVCIMTGCCHFSLC